MIRVHPRRVAIYQKEGETETLIGFAYYQYLELSSQFSHKKFEHYSDQRSDLSLDMNLENGYIAAISRRHAVSR